MTRSDVIHECDLFGGGRREDALRFDLPTTGDMRWDHFHLQPVQGAKLVCGGTGGACQAEDLTIARQQRGAADAGEGATVAAGRTLLANQDGEVEAILPAVT